MTNTLAFRFATCAALVAVAHIVPAAAAAQADAHATLVPQGSLADDSARLASLLTRTASAYSLLRSASTLVPRLPGASRSLRTALILPEQYLIRNSGLPYSPNDGALWAGRGLGYRIRAGFR